MRILLVEDETVLAESLTQVLRDDAYAVDRAADGHEADELAAINDYDLVILDWSLPSGPSGFDLLQRWRSGGDETPVLMMTARAAVDDRVEGLDAGADDYLTKPFSFDELMARVRSLLRRRGRSLAPLVAGDVRIDRASRTVEIAGEVVELPPKELGVLEYLMRRVDETVSRTEIAEHVWDDSFDAMSNVIDVIIYRLRKKIDGGRDAKLLRTVKGVGYRLSSRRE